MDLQWKAFGEDGSRASDSLYFQGYRALQERKFKDADSLFYYSLTWKDRAESIYFLALARKEMGRPCRLYCKHFELAAVYYGHSDARAMLLKECLYKVDTVYSYREQSEGKDPTRFFDVNFSSSCRSFDGGITLDSRFLYEMKKDMDELFVRHEMKSHVIGEYFYHGGRKVYTNLWDEELNYHLRFKKYRRFRYGDLFKLPEPEQRHLLVLQVEVSEKSKVSEVSVLFSYPENSEVNFDSAARKNVFRFIKRFGIIPKPMLAGKQVAYLYYLVIED